MITLYGIHNCDTVKKARAWLGERGLAYRFHDFRADGLDLPLLERMERALGWESLLNRRGTTWRNLAEPDRHDLDRAKALRLMLAHPTVIKRPVLEINDKMIIGFSPDTYAQELLTP
jgi:Spx/MgsR family transcriptional regulator